MAQDSIWIKICGITSADAVAAALAAGVDALGFVFAPSVRQLEPAQAAQLAAAARGRARLIAVTLHPTQASVDEIVRVFKPDVLQSDWEDFGGLQLPGSLALLPVMRAHRRFDAVLPQRLLYEGVHSGSGSVADWERAAQLARSSHLILAGGLTAHNVAAAIGAVRPYGVDVSSGVESEAGRKSAHKIAEFVAAARAGFHGIDHELN